MRTYCMTMRQIPGSFNLADLWELIADEVPEREALVCGDQRRTYAQIEERSNRLASWMRDRGVGPGDFVGLYLRNGAEYIEAMWAAYKLRAVPVNVNYRYVADELLQLFTDGGVVGVVHDAGFGARMEEVARRVPSLAWSLPTGPAYDEAPASGSPERKFDARSGDDLYVLYTGGTTGLPKGVVWRSEDAFFACIGGGDPMRTAGPVTTTTELVERIVPGFTFLPVAPLMHAAGCWTAMMWFYAGGRVVLAPGSFDPRRIWELVAAEGVNLLSIVGDAMARPLLDAWDEHGGYDISSLLSIGSGGAPLTASIRERMTATFPTVLVTDGFGSSETGIQGANRSGSGNGAGRFNAPNAVVLDETTLRPVIPGSGTVGRVARSGHIPLRYHGDAAKTASTFVEVDGTRYVVSGDMATVEAQGTISLLGRGSGCINTGGEKVFPEEVEAVLRSHPDVYDVLVVGAPDERWGQRVVAVVQPSGGTRPDADGLRWHCRAHLAGYKVPKDVILVETVVRSPAGKADYRWAAAIATDEGRAEPASPE
ncbi:MAG: acyl-CoA synthetase [Acidimicrobiales bacterium]